MNAMCDTPADAWSMWLLWGRQGGAGLRGCVFSADTPFLRTLVHGMLRSPEMRASPFSRVILLTTHFPSHTPWVALTVTSQGQRQRSWKEALATFLHQILGGHTLESTDLAAALPAVPISPASPAPHTRLTSVSPSCPLHVSLLSDCYSLQMEIQAVKLNLNFREQKKWFPI